MVWKSAPNGSTLPVIAPFTSPPRIGMMRRTPMPVSPAVTTSPIFAVMVKTYFVSSAGVVIASPLLRHHSGRQPGRQQREGDQDHQPHQVGDHERNHALEDRGEGDVLHHAFYDKDVHADR